MAYVKTTWVDDADPAVTAAQLNRIEQGIADAHLGDTSRLGVLLTRGTTQSPTNGNPIAWTQSLVDLSAGLMWNATTNPSRITITSAGLWLVGFSVFCSSLSNYFQCLVKKNGTTWALEEYVSVSPQTDGAVNASRPMALVAGDYLEVWPQSNAGAQVVQSYPERSPLFWAFKLGLTS